MLFPTEELNSSPYSLHPQQWQIAPRGTKLNWDACIENHNKADCFLPAHNRYRDLVHHTIPFATTLDWRPLKRGTMPSQFRTIPKNSLLQGFLVLAGTDGDLVDVTDEFVVPTLGVLLVWESVLGSGCLARTIHQCLEWFLRSWKLIREMWSIGWPGWSNRFLLWVISGRITSVYNYIVWDLSIRKTYYTIILSVTDESKRILWTNLANFNQLEVILS